jgi:LysR family transcriptional regulator, transcriptional activator of the cysJI operon
MQIEARLRAFASFARQRSFSGAAKELRISQPAISKHIADIEQELGVKLVERLPRGGRLTPAGELLASHVLRAEGILTQAARGVAALRELESGSLSVVSSGVPGSYLLPEALARFQAAHPAIKLGLELTTSRDAVDAVRGHRAEIGVVGGFVAAPELEAEPWIEDEIIIVGHPKLAKDRLSRDELEALTWISRDAGSATRSMVESALMHLGLVPKRRLEQPSWEAVKLTARRGHGVAGISRFAVIDELQSGALAEIPMQSWNLRRTFSIIRVRDAALTPAAHQFLLMLRGPDES